MAQAILAPVLSATSKWERTCNIKSGQAATGGFRLVALDDFHQPPAFHLGQRPRFLDAHAVARLGLALFVVGVKLLVGGHDLLVLRMRETALDAHDDGLGHLVGDDFADAFLALAALPRLPSQCWLLQPYDNYFARLGRFVAQLRNARFEPRDVLAQRAQARRLFQLALACCKRRLNISCRRSRLLAANSTSVISLISDRNFHKIQLSRADAAK